MRKPIIVKLDIIPNDYIVVIEGSAMGCFGTVTSIIIEADETYVKFKTPAGTQITVPCTSVSKTKKFPKAPANDAFKQLIVETLAECEEYY